MSLRLPSKLLLSLLCSSAMIPVALAQADSNQASEQGQGCEALAQLIDENRDRLRQEWTSDAQEAVQADNMSECTSLHAEASSALGLAEEGGQPSQQTAEGTRPGAAAGAQDEQMSAEAAARIVVTQPDPQVSVQTQAPQVAVTQPQPQVRVDQGQPEVLVRQMSPTIRVEVPQPTITVDMPQPEIIIRMPDPQVAVSSPQPQVEVRQAEPQVSVEMAEPQVQVQPTPDEGEATAEVEVQQGEPDVTHQFAEGQPQIELNRQEPKVSYQAARPEIDVQMVGEPKVQFNTVGEPDIRIETLGQDGQTAQRPDDQQPADEQQTAQRPGEQQPAEQQTAQRPDEQQPADQQTAQTEGQQVDEELQTGSIGTQAQQQPDEAAEGDDRMQTAARTEGDQAQQDQTTVAALLQITVEPMEAGSPSPYAVADLVGKQLVNAEGTDLGRVEGVVEASGQRYLVLGADSVLSDGQASVVLPLEKISFDADRLVFLGMTEQELAELQQYDGSAAEPVPDDQQIEIATR